MVRKEVRDEREFGSCASVHPRRATLDRRGFDDGRRSKQPIKKGREPPVRALFHVRSTRLEKRHLPRFLLLLLP